MKNSTDRMKAARDLLRAVREIFGRWDASDVLGSAEGKDEERLDEECIAKLSAMVVKNASVPEIAAYLDRLVSKSVGLSSDAGRNREFAEQFVAVGKGHRL